MTQVASAAHAYDGIHRGRFKILIADDDPLTRLTVGKFLEQEGFECAVAESGASALEAMAQADFDTVVADISMEGNSRLEMVRQMRETGQNCPVILVTGDPSLATATASLSLNVAAYLTKPLDYQELVATIRMECERGSIHRMLRDHRARQDQALVQLRAVEAVFSRTRGREAKDALQLYLSLSFEQLMTTLVDLKAMISFATDLRPEAAQNRLNATPPLVLVAAIKETIQVLERTRSSFKSQELAALRKKLEELLQPKRVAAPTSIDSAPLKPSAPQS